MVAQGKPVNFLEHNSVKHSIITTGFNYALATGNWGDRSNPDSLKKGVSQVLSRLTYAASLSHLRRCRTPIDGSNKDPRPRELHGTQVCLLLYNFFFFLPCLFFSSVYILVGNGLSLRDTRRTNGRYS